MAIFPNKLLPNPIPFALHLSSKTPISLPLLARSQVPRPAVVHSKTKAVLKTEALSHNPVKLLAEARQKAADNALHQGGGADFPRNLKIESLVDEKARFKTRVKGRVRNQLAKALVRRG